MQKRNSSRFIGEMSDVFYNFVVVIQTLLSALPMTVCLFWTVTLACDVTLSGARNSPNHAAKGWLQPRILLLVFFLVTTLLYFGHCVYFNRITALLPPPMTSAAAWATTSSSAIPSDE